MDSAVPPALEENERLRAKLLRTEQRFLAYVRADCDKCWTIARLIREALDRMAPGADARQVLWDLISGIIAANAPIDF